MQKLLEWVLNWPALKGRRTQIVQGLFVLYGAYNALIATHLIQDVLSPEWQSALFSLFAAYGLKFAKSHDNT